MSEARVGEVDNWKKILHLHLSCSEQACTCIIGLHCRGQGVEVKNWNGQCWPAYDHALRRHNTMLDADWIAAYL